jgi:hypothetical protein
MKAVGESFKIHVEGSKIVKHIDIIKKIKERGGLKFRKNRNYEFLSWL